MPGIITIRTVTPVGSKKVYMEREREKSKRKMEGEKMMEVVLNEACEGDGEDERLGC